MALKMFGFGAHGPRGYLKKIWVRLLNWIIKLNFQHDENLPSQSTSEKGLSG